MQRTFILLSSPILRNLWRNHRKTFVKIIVISHSEMSSMSNDISGMRKPYHSAEEKMDIPDLKSHNPFEQFQHWFDEARNHPKTEEANAMVVASATRDGVPSLRWVLLKGFSDKGFVFYTNYESRKGRELTDNPRASLGFYWEHLKRQVRIEGIVEKLSPEESDKYFDARPVESRFSASCSPQSTVLPDRQALLQLYESKKADYEKTGEIKRPDNWGGFLVRPHLFEFWQGQTSRLHDRLIFKPSETGDKWTIERLAP